MNLLPLLLLLQPARVQAADTARAVDVDNGAVRLTIEKASGDITSLRLHDGPDLLDRRRPIYWDANGGPRGPVHISGGAFTLTRRDGGAVDCAVTRPPDSTFPFHVTLHYVVRPGDEGLYCYVTVEHAASAPVGTIGQSRMVAKLRESLFTHYFVSERCQGLFPKAPAGAALQPVTDATVRFPDGTIATKYNLAEFEDGHHVHGAAGPQGGVWFITPSNEYVNGGPTKQDLMVHQDSVILLRMFHSGHFLDGRHTGIRAEGDWGKVYGPFFIYLNAGKPPAALWADARRRAEQEERVWPYAWVASPHYAVRRGAVTGRLRLAGRPACGATLVLAAPRPDWQIQGEGYLFSAHADAAGRFTLPKVVPGTYTLYAFGCGEPGEFRHNGVTVSAGATADLGTLAWAPQSHGRLLWQVGTPDRTANEFRHGGERRQFGLWQLYPREFPNDVNFTVGRSRERSDWNYCQPVAQRADGVWHVPDWRIVFTQSAVPHGQATLTVGIAGASGGPRIMVRVNGHDIGAIRLGSDPGVYRDGTSAGQYSEHVISFDAALLQTGENRLSLRLDGADTPPGPVSNYALPRQAVMYDFVRLEAAR